VGKTYTFSKIGLKMANKKFDATKCPYEMSVGGRALSSLDLSRARALCLLMFTLSTANPVSRSLSLPPPPSLSLSLDLSFCPLNFVL
jgi:hypothetical protein